ncbi:maleylpyruvate isomerase family mycothiol-dependent enzyme [Mycobacterium sp. ITM-2016-00317]|uniref:maleylpyruvate isomerase family mycothiol-dependent enzyme n=1 Tax=Mycobacterium sp. ITM-2016-00317 TaxID=2099694 RepID=UPI00287FC5FE|nr:maleylpyruvate isomerase family mycothiol-dependent enzyme [Mycobacterium sp. ITM-2016-00317]WNG88231.1 maleylpyruvate isomerase family mycothiol-dependent enzyme [Mycobacterium sp. ITM-2016-00317]
MPASDAPASSDAVRIARLYEETRRRIADLLEAAGSAAWGTPVPACPGWSVRDVVSHLSAVAQDWAAGSLTGAPTDAQTAEHVRRFAGSSAPALIAAWADAADLLGGRAHRDGLEAPLGDIVSHEHDIRAALGRPGARDSASVHWTSDLLLSMLRTPVPLQVQVEDGRYLAGDRTGGGDGLVLRTTRFEALRWRTGRRSPAQLAAMDWSADPTPVLGHLCLFGPATSDVVE